MTNTAKLRDDHRKLMSIVRRLRLVIERRKPWGALHLFTLRHELTSTLIAHLQVEDWLLYPPLVDSPEPQVAATARAFNAEMGGLADLYRVHCEKWSAIAIAMDWPGYGRECSAILDALTIRITREDREPYPLLGRVAVAA